MTEEDRDIHILPWTELSTKEQAQIISVIERYTGEIVWDVYLVTGKPPDMVQDESMAVTLYAHHNCGEPLGEIPAGLEPADPRVTRFAKVWNEAVAELADDLVEEPAEDTEEVTRPMLTDQELIVRPFEELTADQQYRAQILARRAGARWARQARWIEMHPTARPFPRPPVYSGVFRLAADWLISDSDPRYGSFVRGWAYATDRLLKKEDISPRR